MTGSAIWNKLFKTQNQSSTTWVERSADRRKENLGRLLDRRKRPDRRQPSDQSGSYEYIGLTKGGWIKSE